MSVTPFALASLPRIARDETRLASQVRSAAASLVDAEQIASALSELVGEAVTISIRHVGTLDAVTAPSDGLGVLFSRAEAHDVSRAVLVDAEASLGAAIVARALKHRAPRVVDGSRASHPELAGAFAAVLHATFRRAHAGRPLHVLAAGPGSALARDLVGAASRVVTIWVTVTLGSDVFGARVCIPLTELPSPESAPFSRATLTTLGDLPLGVPLVVASCLAERELLLSLARGDVFVVPRFPLSSKDGALAGPIAIAAPSSDRAIGGQLEPNGRLMLRSGPAVHLPFDRTEEARIEGMSEETNPTLAVASDAPVVVRVELGVVEMPARQWANLAPGDVIALGRRLGDAAILRVGGVEVARGELVQVDGEYGVRIVPRTGDTR